MRVSWRNNITEFNRHITEQMQKRVKDMDIDALSVVIPLTPYSAPGDTITDNEFLVYVVMAQKGSTKRCELTTYISWKLLNSLSGRDFVSMLFNGVKRGFEYATGQRQRPSSREGIA